MTPKGLEERLLATDSSPRPGHLPVGSVQSRAAARALLTARNAKDRDEAGFKVIYRADGSVGEIHGLADVLRAARMRHDTGGSSESLPQGEARQDYIRGGHEKCLAERIRMAKERLAGK